MKFKKFIASLVAIAMIANPSFVALADEPINEDIDTVAELTEEVSDSEQTDTKFALITDDTVKEVDENEEKISPLGDSDSEFAYPVEGGNIYIYENTLAYADSEITSADIPSKFNNMDVTRIGNSAFNGCSNLTSVTIPDSVTSISGFAFQGCSSLTSITIPDGVTSIAGFTFEGCSSLTSITIPNNVTSIGNSAFAGCSSLTSITIPDNVTSIGDYAFSGCSNLQAVNVSENNSVYKSVDGVLFDKSGDDLLIFPEGKSAISYEIPSYVSSIGDDTFVDCSNITSITIPNSVISIGNGSFNGCSSLQAINVSENNLEYKSIDGILFNKSGTFLIKFPQGKSNTSYEIPTYVTSINSDAFYGCSNLTSIIIPESVKSIGEYGTFEECSSLTSITIPNSIKSIGMSMFEGCNNLTSITISNNVKSIEGWAFNECSSLKDVYYDGSEEDWNNITIDELYNDALKNATIHYNSKEESTEVTTANIIEGWIFDADLYRAKNPDLAAIYGDDDYGLYQHWLNCGIREGRIGSYIFDPGYYSEKYEDLRAAFNNDYMEFYNHFLNYGINELRQASWQYNGAVYKENYSFDGWSGEDLIWHYTHYGRAEGRQATGITYKDTFFNADYYRANNPDVVAYYGENVTDEQLYYHWCYNGVNEGRSGSPVYNEDYYIANNPDVGEAYTTHLDRYNHFFERGSAEGRAASADFDLTTYKANNPDLVAVFGDYNKAYYEHYANYGYSEGRIAK
jgi:hypothetical protein